MEAASSGYVDVGRVLIDKGADVNASPVPSSKDTALTIAADKGHVRFVELLVCKYVLSYYRVSCNPALLYILKLYFLITGVLRLM